METGSPFTTVLRTGRIEQGGADIADSKGATTFEADWRGYSRSASDDKALIIIALCVEIIAAVLRM